MECIHIVYEQWMNYMCLQDLQDSNEGQDELFLQDEWLNTHRDRHIYFKKSL